MGNYYLYVVAHFFARVLPLPVTYGLATFLADCHFFFSHEDRKAVEENLKVVLKTEHVPPAMVREMFRNFGRYLADFFTMTWNFDENYVKTKVKVENMEYLNDVLKYGKGCILISAHLGNWEMGGAILGILGYPLSVLALPHKDPRVNKFFNSRREHFGSTVIQTTTAIRKCLEDARNNRIVAILAERDFGNNGLVMDFLGRPTMIPKGAALFSLKTGAPILPGFFIRRDKGHFTVVLERPIYPPAQTKEKITDEALKSMIRQYLPLIENQIRRYPDQWLMFRKFWVS